MLDRLLDGPRAGRSGALVLGGEAGVGKTALLDYAIASASGVRVLRATGVESEMELAFAALHQLCAPPLDRLDRLPGPQRDALQTTFGLHAGVVPDRLFVGLAVLGLLSEVAEERPILCVVDDAQWLDKASAQTLTFVARRLVAESLVMLFATREPSDLFAGVPELVIEGLRGADARSLWRRFFRGGWTRRSPTACWPRRAETHWRCWNFRGGSPPRSWRAGSGCPERCRCRAGLRRAS